MADRRALTVVFGYPGPWLTELDAGLLLRVADDAEEIAALRIAARAEHADEALRLRPRRLAKLLEADRRLDVVAQNRLAGVDIAGDAIRFCISSLKLPVSAISSLRSSFIAPFGEDAKSP